MRDDAAGHWKNAVCDMHRNCECTTGLADRIAHQGHPQACSMLSRNGWTRKMESDRPRSFGLAVALVEGCRSFRLQREATLGAMVLWTGLVRIATAAGIVDRVRAPQGNSRVAALFRLTENLGRR